MKTTSSSASQASGKAAIRRSRSVRQADSPSGTPDCPREQMIAEAAYFRAELRGFASGSEMSDWLAAEMDVEHLLNDRQ